MRCDHMSAFVSDYQDIIIANYNKMAQTPSLHLINLLKNIFAFLRKCIAFVIVCGIKCTLCRLQLTLNFQFQFILDAFIALINSTFHLIHFYLDAISLFV